MPASHHPRQNVLAGIALLCVLGGMNDASAQETDASRGRLDRLAVPRTPATRGATGIPELRRTAVPTADESVAAATPGVAGPGSTAVVGSVPRAGLRPAKTRRSRPPAQLPIRADFRATIAPPAVAADVQPLQTGVPDARLSLDPRRRRPAIDDPYAPLGLRVGNVIITPTLGQSFGYDTNPNRLSTNKNASALSFTEGEIGIQSDWSRHDLYGQLRGGYSEYFDNPAARRPEGQGNLRLRLDVTRDTEIDVEGHYLIDTQRPSSPDLNANVVSRPIIYTEGASIGVTQRLNRFLVALRGTIDRYDFEDARLPGGIVIDQSDRALTQYGFRARLGYELNPGLIPFVEGFVDTRRYDRQFDSNGFQRSSDGVGVKAGALVELSRLLTAEVSGGTTQRSYEDPRLGTLASPVADASLVYTLTALTTIRGTAAASVEETTVAGARGIRALRGTIEVAHALRRDLTLTAGLRAFDNAYQGVAIEEQGYGAFLRADWRFNRNVALRASYVYENLKSTFAPSSYTSSTFLFGLRLTP